MQLLIVAVIFAIGMALWRPRARENGVRRDGLLLLAGLLFAGALVSVGLRRTKWHLYGEEGIVLGIVLAILFAYIAAVYPRWLLPPHEMWRSRAPLSNIVPRALYAVMAVIAVWYSYSRNGSVHVAHDFCGARYASVESPSQEEIADQLIPDVELRSPTGRLVGGEGYTCKYLMRH